MPTQTRGSSRVSFALTDEQRGPWLTPPRGGPYPDARLGRYRLDFVEVVW
jgi:hypothetical protein